MFVEARQKFGISKQERTTEVPVGVRDGEGRETGPARAPGEGPVGPVGRGGRVREARRSLGPLGRLSPPQRGAGGEGFYVKEKGGGGCCCQPSGGKENSPPPFFQWLSTFHNKPGRGAPYIQPIPNISGWRNKLKGEPCPPLPGGSGLCRVIEIDERGQGG